MIANKKLNVINNENMPIIHADINGQLLDTYTQHIAAPARLA